MRCRLLTKMALIGLIAGCGETKHDSESFVCKNDREWAIYKDKDGVDHKFTYSVVENTILYQSIPTTQSPHSDNISIKSLSTDSTFAMDGIIFINLSDNMKFEKSFHTTCEYSKHINELSPNEEIRIYCYPKFADRKDWRFTWSKSRGISKIESELGELSLQTSMGIARVCNPGVLGN